jgi:hypothetical protein
VGRPGNLSVVLFEMILIRTTYSCVLSYNKNQRAKIKKELKFNSTKEK